MVFRLGGQACSTLIEYLVVCVAILSVGDFNVDVCLDFV